MVVAAAAAIPLPTFLFTSSHTCNIRILKVKANATLITNSDWFQVGRPIGNYGFMNVTTANTDQYSFGEGGGFKTQDVQEGSVKIRLYEGRVSQGPLRQTPVLFKVYPGTRAGGVVADMMAANELNSHMFLQSSSKGMSQHLMLLLGGFETTTGEQWLAFRDYGKSSAADYAKVASEKMSKLSSWNSFEQGQAMKRRRRFIITLLQGAFRGLAYMHHHDRLHQSLGPFSVSLNTIYERESPYLIPRLKDLAFSVSVRYSELEDSGPLTEGLWARASAASAFTYLEKRAFGIADDIYEAGLLFAYLAFVPFCEAGVMDGLSLQVSYAAYQTLSSETSVPDDFSVNFPYYKIISSLNYLFAMSFRGFWRTLFGLILKQCESKIAFSLYFWFNYYRE
ncbi:hypothetical protein RYX36_003004 [Vicia faba]